MRLAFLAPAVLAFVSCTSAGTISTGSAVPATTSRNGALKYSAGTARYRAVSHARQQQQIESNRQELNFVLEYLATTTLTPAAGGALQLEFVIDSVRSEGALVNPGELARARGAKVTGAMGPDGRVTDLTGDSVLTGQLQSIATGIRQFFPRIPADGVGPGRSWSDSSEVETSGSPRITITGAHDRTAADWTEYAGRKALRIDVVTHYTIVGSGQQMGQDFTLGGTGERQTAQYISEDGRYLGATGHDSSLVTISLSGIGMTFPSVQVRNDTVGIIF